MSWSPSVLKVFKEKQIEEKRDKKIVLGAESRYEGILLNKSTENIFAGNSFSQRNKGIRPVMLTVCYTDELIVGENSSLAKDVSEVNEELVTSFNEISSAVKESMRVEKELIQCLERNEVPEKTKIFLTTKTKDFFISRNRLLGEILKAQRKIEKSRSEGAPLFIQMCLEYFIRRLCTFKVLADKTDRSAPENSLYKPKTT